MRRQIAILCSGLFLVMGCQQAAEPISEVKQEASAPPADPVALVEGVLAEFQQGSRSDDEATRLKALALIEPNASDFETLFGSEDGAAIWEKYEAFAKMLRENTHRLKQQLEMLGQFESVEARKVSLQESNAYFRKNPDKVPEGVTAYDEHVKGDRGSAGGGTYYLIQDRVVFIRSREIDSIVDELENK